MKCFSAKSTLGFIWFLSFKWKSRFLQFLSAELTENKIKSMPEILEPRSFKWCIVCSFVMLSCWEDAFQAKHPFFHTKMKTFISQQRSSAGMFGWWFYDVLGLPQPLIPITQNRYVDSALWGLDQLLTFISDVIYFLATGKFSTRKLIRNLAILVTSTISASITWQHDLEFDILSLQNVCF